MVCELACYPAAMPRNLDINQLAKRLVDQATGELPKVDPKKQAAGRKGGAVGGKKRMASATAEEKARLSALGVAARKKKAPAVQAGAKITK